MAVQTKQESREKRGEKTKSAFQLEHLFGSKTRARLLGVFLNHPNEAFFVRELTRKIDAQLNSVRREIENLLALDLLKEEEAKEVKGKKVTENKKFFTANTESVLFEDLRHQSAGEFLCFRQETRRPGEGRRPTPQREASAIRGYDAPFEYPETD